jgi:branched-chain amino acid transport system ATP-binding protein
VSRSHAVSRAQRSAQQSAAVRCRPGTVANSELGTVPDQRCSVWRFALTLHRIRDTGTAGVMTTTADHLLEVRALDAHYGDFQALFGVSMTIAEGDVVAVIGANGAGKSTLLRCIAGAMRVRRDALRFAGELVGGEPAYAMVARGVALVPEGRRLFASLTVEENLLIGSQLGRPGPWNLQRVYRLFPMLAERRAMPAPSLSGGQQQMVAIGRALMSNPKLLLCDEISLGLAPIVIRDIYAQLPNIVSDGTSLVIVEQDIVQALKTARHVYCLQEGRVALAGEAGALTREAVSAAYFGV